jgi:AcrR family transcriptional regulator
MPSRAKSSPRRAATRQRLIEAAVAVVAEHGFHSATVDRIAERAGFSIGALYGNFAGKDELFLAVFDAHLDWFEATIEAGRTAEDPAAALDAWLDVLTQNPAQFLVFIDFWAYAMRTPAFRAPFRKRMKRMREIVIRAAKSRSAERGEPLPLSPETSALLLMSVARGLALEKLADPRSVSDSELKDLFSGLLS